MAQRPDTPETRNRRRFDIGRQRPDTSASFELMNTLRDLPLIRDIPQVLKAAQPSTTVMQLPRLGNLPRVRLEKRYALTTQQPRSYGGRVVGATVVLGALTALWVGWKARKAEAEHPRVGRVIDVNGVKIHVRERGEGTPVVLLHGNTVTLEDFEAAGLTERLAQNHRVYAFDRPGFGYSERPRGKTWNAQAQAQLIASAMQQLNIKEAAVVGHSAGAGVALALALDHPHLVKSLSLISGYYYPYTRLDAIAVSPNAMPVIGDVMRYTTGALTGRAMFGRLVKTMFAPQPVPGHFYSDVSREMMLRPSQIRADAEDASCMTPDAKRLCKRYAELQMPVTIIAGAQDKVVDPIKHAARLHGEISGSVLVIVPAAGHMVHYKAQDKIASAVDMQPQLQKLETRTRNNAVAS